MMDKIKKTDRYPGTHPFSVEDQSIFFGRDEDIENFSQLVLLERQVVLYGKSGLGKSSLLNAGVVPKLGGQDNYEAFQIRFTSYTPDKEDTPSDILRKKISEQVNYDNFLWEKIINFHPDKIDSLESMPDLDILSDLWYYFKSLQIQEPKKNIFVLVLDQFEELFTYPDDQVERFSQELANLINVHVPQFVRNKVRFNKTGEELITQDESRLLFRLLNIKIVIATRSDKMSLLNKLKRYNPEILQKTYELRPLEINQARDAILKPAGLKDSETLKFNSPPFQFDPGALNAMLTFLSKGGQQKIETFQLQILCKYAENKVQEKKGYPRVVTTGDLGKVEDIFENYYDDRISLIPEDQEIKVRKFIEEGLIFEEDQRRLSVYEGQAERQFGISPELLAQLVETRLIRTEPHSSGGFSYELSHDTLVAPILKAKARRIEAEKRAAEQQKWKEKQQKINRKYRTAGLIVISIFIALIAGFMFMRAAKKEADIQRNIAVNALIKLTESLKDNALLKYETKINEGTVLQEDKKFTEALQMYRTALDEVRTYNADAVDSMRLDTSRALNHILDCQNQEILASVFNSFMISGDSLAKLGPDFYDDAKQQYSQAREMNFDNDLVRQKSALLNSKIDVQVDKYINNARLFLDRGRKAFALEWLEKAKVMKNHDPVIDSLMILCKE